jgi:GH24 family phage-related lysozyme (muramidase)
MLDYKIMRTGKIFLRYIFSRLKQKQCQACVSFAYTNSQKTPVLMGLSKVVL